MGERPRGRPAGGGLAEGGLQPEPEGLGIDGHDDSAICRHRILDRRQRIAAIAQKLAVQKRLLRAQRRAGKGHPHKAAGGRRAIGGLEGQRHLRPRPLGSCHGVSPRRDDRRLQARRALDGQINRARGFRLDPVAAATECAVGRDHRADTGAKGGEARVAIGALHDRFDLGAVLVVVAQRRQRHTGFPGLAIAQDHQADSGNALGQDHAAQHRHMRHQAQQVRQGRQDGFADCGHVRRIPGLRDQPGLSDPCPVLGQGGLPNGSAGPNACAGIR